jgi:hypothetical protein
MHRCRPWGQGRTIESAGLIACLGAVGVLGFKGQGLLWVLHPARTRPHVKACAASCLGGTAYPGTAKGSAEVLLRFDQAHPVFLKHALATARLAWEASAPSTALLAA